MDQSPCYKGLNIPLYGHYVGTGKTHFTEMPIDFLDSIFLEHRKAYGVHTVEERLKDDKIAYEKLVQQGEAMTGKMQYIGGLCETFLKLRIEQAN